MKTFTFFEILTCMFLFALVLLMGIRTDSYSYMKWGVFIVALLGGGANAFLKKDDASWFFKSMMIFSFYCFMLDLVLPYTNFNSLSLFNTFMMAYLLSYRIENSSIFYIFILSIVLACIAIEILVFRNGVTAYISGTNGRNANAVGMLTYLGAVGTFVLLVLSKKYIYKLFFCVSLVVFYYFSLLLGSRQTFVVPTLFIVLFFIIKYFKFSFKNILMLLIVISIAYIAITYLLDNFRDTMLVERATTSDDYSRVDLFEYSINKFKEKPLLGHGLGTFKAYQGYFVYSHNTTSELLFCTGIVGTILFYLPYLLLVVKYFKVGVVWRRQNNSKTMPNSISLSIAFFISILVGAQFSILYYLPINAIMMMFFIKYCSGNVIKNELQ